MYSSVILPTLLILILTTLIPQTAIGVKRVCKTNELCVDINRPTANPNNDLALRYRYSGPNGNGKTWALKNGSILRNGDRFSIEIKANRSMYLYLFHFDSIGQLYELLSLSKKSNHIKAGQPLLLPGANQHFSLDNNTGTETIHAIVSLTPQNNLMAKYRRALLVNPEIHAAAQRGVTVGTDPGATPHHDHPVTETKGHTIACQGGKACRETFIIYHRRRN